MGLTYKEAAATVRRSVRTIKRWRRGGMQMGWEIRDGQRMRVVEIDVLRAYLRARLMADPAHQYRMRKQREGMQG